MPSKNLTLRQADVLITLRNLYHLNGYMPSILELSVELKRARGTIMQHLQALNRKGAIRIHPRKARAIEIITAA
jgi:repressor LexA